MASHTPTTTANRRPQPPQPPGYINAHKFADSRSTELQSLHSIISNRLNNDFRSRRNKRRRTNSFATKHHRRSGEEKKVSRRARRRVDLKMNMKLGFGVSGDGTKRLRTHMWLAKRFTMIKYWGFYLPLGLHGSGRGSRALLKWCKQGAVVHDASYYSLVQLKASQEALLSLTTVLLLPFPMDSSEDRSRRTLSGNAFGTAMLHHPEQGRSSKPICPVTYMWRPFHHHQNDFPAEDGGEHNANIEVESNPDLHQIWIWMHPSASSEGLDCLKLFCQNMMNETGVAVDCVSLDGQLGRIEVLGEEAFQILQKILQPRTLSSEKPWKLNSCSMLEHTNGRGIKHNNIVDKEECFSSHAVVPLEVVDPRLLSRKSNSESTSSLSNHKDLWDAGQGVQPPMEEHLLCQERHTESLDFFCLKGSPSAKAIQKTDNFSTSCPILLMRHNYQSCLLNGWSIVLPLSWVKAFWVPLVSRGAHAIGLREKRWISCDGGLPYFPSDFPDCSAYSRFKASEAEGVDQTMERRPPAMRPFKVPILLPWNSKCFTFDEGVEGEHSADHCAHSCGVPPSGSCEVLVSRACSVLSSFLKEISGDHLLLFPKGLYKDGFSCLMKDDTRIRQASDVVTLASQGRKLCYLRVLLHAFKEGVFEEGAVVCAPHFSDISLWTSRSDSDERLHMPDTFVGSYFKEQPSGEWDFQFPEDSAAREAFRRPLGFVTTGFVRGSKRSVAVGLCEAVLLARLRLDQWSQTPAKKRRKEIYVVVRNQRSNAYRLALATIVLEEQENDVESL